MASLPSNAKLTFSRPVQGSNKTKYSVTQVFAILIEPNDVDLQVTDDSFTKRFKFFFDKNSDIQQDDKFTWQGKDFRVGAVSLYGYGSLQHKFSIAYELQT